MSEISDARRIVGPTGPLARIAYGLNVWTGKHLPLEIDPVTWGLHSIESEHHEIHEGVSYTAFYSRTTAATDNHRSAIYIRTPTDGIRAHMIVSYAASHPADCLVCEGVTIDANAGTHTSVMYNRDRNSSSISACVNNATVPARGHYTTLDETAIAAAAFSTGTVIREEALEAGSGPRAVGGVSRGNQEYILRAGTPYVFLLRNDGANANQHWIFLDWYEHKQLDH